MSDNNDFLSHYGQNRPEEKEIVIQDAPLPAYKYEQKSGFKAPERHDMALPTPPGRRKLIIGIAAGAVALVLVVVLVLVFLLNGGVEMKDLTGWTMTDADLWAKENGVQLQATEEFNDAYAEGVVFGQDVDPGTRVKKGDFIKVTVSKGHDLGVTLTLPDLKSMTMTEVQAWADQNFMTKVRITTEFSDTVPSGSVISFEVNDDRVTGDVVRRDSPVYVVVSKGPEDEAALQVTLPDFKTMALSEAYVFANENGLTLVVTQQYDDYIAAGSVISQSIKAAEKVSRGTEITLIVSMGKKIIVPDFSDYTKEGASAKAAELGIPITVIDKYSSSSVGSFLSQSIDAGTVYVTGDILELTYSLGKIIVPSFIGQTRDAMETWRAEVNSHGGRINITEVQPRPYSNSPAGTILNQDKANTAVNAGTTITITVSKGKLIYVPDFADEGSTYNHAILREDALAMCDELGLIPVFVEGTPTSGTWLPGEVFKQDPNLPAGSEATQGTKITLTFVKSETITIPGGIPDFTGNDPTVAASTYGSQLRFVFVEGDTYLGDLTDVVVAQSLTVGSTVAKGTTITLTLGQP